MSKIKVRLIKSKETEILRFFFNPTEDIDLLSDDSVKLKRFFERIIDEMTKAEFELDFESELENDLYTDVSKKYVALLNTEIKSIRLKIPSK